MDLAKYHALFVEDSTEHLAEIGRRLLELEKAPDSADAIGEIFRMAHSIKGMAASLGYDGVSEVAHCLEDRMQNIRDRGRLSGADELSRLFRGLAGLEAMVAVARDSGEPPPPDPGLVQTLSAPASPADPAPPASAAKKKTPDSVAAPEPAPRCEGVDAPSPPPSVRVSTETLDRFLNTVGEVILSSSQLRSSDHSGSAPSADFSEGLDRMDRVVGELQRRALDLRTTELQRIVEPLPRLAREIAERAGKRVAVELRNAELELDRSILDRLSDPLVHLVRNAVDHGVETPEARSAAGKDPVGHLTIEARRERDTIHIAVSDDGDGIDLEAVRSRAVEAGVLVADLAEDLPEQELASFIFHPGLSTARSVTDISGRGVGMDAVKATIESLGGHVQLHTSRGCGTTTTLVVPITAAVQRVLLVHQSGETLAIPVARVQRILELPASEIEQSGSEAFALIDDEPLPVLDLAQHVRLPPSPPQATVSLVVADLRDGRAALRVDAFAGQQQIYVKPVPEVLSAMRALAGLTILGDGRPVFLLDLNQLA